MWCYNTYADFMISLLLVIINDRTCLISIYDILVLYSPISQLSNLFSMKIYFFMMENIKKFNKVESKFQRRWQFRFKCLKNANFFVKYYKLTNTTKHFSKENIKQTSLNFHSIFIDFECRTWLVARCCSIYDK